MTSRKKTHDTPNDEYVESPYNGRWIKVGGPSWRELIQDPRYKKQLLNAERKSRNVAGKFGCTNERKYQNQNGPFCGVSPCPRTFPVRSEGEYRTALRYAHNSTDPQAVIACAKAVKKNGFRPLKGGI